MFFTLTRATLITALVNHVATLYVDNHESIYHGKFNAALLEYDKESKYYKALTVLQNVSVKYIYQNKSVQTLELQGYTIVNGLLDIYKPLLVLSTNDFTSLLDEQRIECFISTRLIKRISSKQIVAYKADINNLDKTNYEEYTILEWYHRVRLIIDYISGMTDDFALHEYQVLTSFK